MTEIESSQAITSLDEPLPPHYTWNVLALGADFALFSVASSFISQNVVLSSFIAELSNSTVLVGLASGLLSGAWLVPQLLIASAVARFPRKKPIMVGTAWPQRTLPLFLGLMIWLLGISRPGLTLTLVIAGLVIFYILDALVSVPWFDLLARMIPARRRGRVLGAGQVLSGIGGIGAGVAVNYILSDKGPWAFPNNYAMLFAIASGFFLLAAVGLTLLREPKATVAAQQVPPFRQILAAFPRILAEDHAFRRLIIVRVLMGFSTLSNAFYVLHAIRVARLGESATGFFVSAQVVGGLVAGLMMAPLQDRGGPLVHLRVNIGLCALSPLLGLLIEPLMGALGPRVLYLYLLVYFIVGVFSGSFGWPTINYALEHAPEAWRPLYIGLLNTSGALAMLTPTLGGWIASTVSYPAVFALGVVFAVAAMLVSLTVPSTRHANKLSITVPLP